MAKAFAGQATAPRSQLYIVKNLHKSAILKKDYREEKRVPAEFFPPKLIFNRCVFFCFYDDSESGGTDSLGPEGRKLVTSI